MFLELKGEKTRVKGRIIVMNSQELAQDILRFVGGKENVQSVTHCATRLRFVLHSNKKADVHSLEKRSGILKVVESGGQFQVVVGNEVPEVYKHIEKEVGGGSPKTEGKEEGDKTSLVSKIFSVISGSLSPMIPVFAGAGLVKALLIILEKLGWLMPDSSTYAILAAAGNSIFYFMPIFLGITIARVYNVNSFIAGAIGAALLEPSFTALSADGVNATSFLGIPVPLLSYASSIFPMFIAVSLYALLERFLKRYIHKTFQLFAVPFFSLIIMVPLTAILIGPFGVYVGEWIGIGVNYLINANAIIAGAILGGTWSFVVLLGLHWAVVPVIISNLSAGGDLIAPLAGSSVAASMGIALGIFLKSKDKDLKALGGTTFISGILSGVTEPILYGIILRYRKTIVYMVIAGAIGGAVMGALGVKLIVFNFFLNIFSVPAQSPMLSYVIATLVAITIGALLPILFGYEVKQNKSGASKHEEQTIEHSSVASNQETTSQVTVYSPLQGKVVDLAQVEDVVFSSESMGKGIAIVPEYGVLVSPFDGTVAVTVGSGHAIAVRSHDGVEVLMHIGIDTVKLKGRHFNQKVNEGDVVSKGDVLIEFDVDAIKQEGFKIITPVIITNTDDCASIKPVTSNQNILFKDKLLTVSK